ncbi:protein FAM185A-like [Clytia hemisphaerica]|uniref:DUF4097 domain-containing protein n=1 Tax=Clytia hemisphaerica TaxID=252671 RepID=A0A7M6DKI1_9CNID
MIFCHSRRVFSNSTKWMRCLQRTKVTFQNMNHFGSLKYACPKIPVVVQCINPHDVPNGDMAFIKMVDNKDGHEILDLELGKYAKAEYCNQQNLLSVSQNLDVISDDRDFSIHIEIPHNYDIEIESEQVSVKETEGKMLKIKSTGNCTLGKIKSGTVDIDVAGDLECKSLLGNGLFILGGEAKFGKIQAKNLSIDNQNGSIDIKSCYCPQMKCTSFAGSIIIGDMHGSSDLNTQSGNISISTLAGSSNITTQQGDINVTVESCKHIFMESDQGNISIGLGDSLAAFLDAVGAYIDVPQDLLVDGMKREESTGIQYFEGKLGDSAENCINAKTLHGTVDFSRKNWFSKFNLDLD